MDAERARENPSGSEGSKPDLLRVLAEYFEDLDLDHPAPLPTLAGKEKDLSRLEAALAASSERCRQAIGNLRRFTSNVSHELLNPLTVIKSKAEVTLLRPRSTEYYEKKLAEIIDHVSSMRNMIESLLELSRLDLAEKPLKLDPVDLQSIAEAACQNLGPIFNRRGQQVIKEVKSASLLGREPLLITLACNLLDNASKYSPPGGRLGIRTFPEDSSGESVLEVWDTGPGMSQEEIRQCFELFWRADGSKHMPGYGIGLPLVYRIAQIHQGRIEVHSKPGEGLLFRVRFPSA
jgi:signal transduction histidine kinase